MTSAVDAAIAALGGVGERVSTATPVGPLTTYRVGGPASVLVRVQAPHELEKVAEAKAASGLPVLVVGMGSNLLVADHGFEGIAIRLDESPEAFGSIEIDGTMVRAGSSVALPRLARRTGAAGLTGLEWAVGVPGSVGGAVRMNAGGHGSDVAASLTRAWLCDLDAGGKVVERSKDSLELGYRTSAVGASQVVVSAEFSLQPGDAEASGTEIREIVRWRREHQPGGQNAGSVFANPREDPEGRSAGFLIEAAGMKGYRLGTAEVSPKHANFIQADPGGSADDVAELMATVQRTVEERFGVRLRRENRLIGFRGVKNQ